ncbi:inner nuclear membrane protein enriched at telomere/subtelomere region [Linnemannia gamsii]|uniref:Inner nuclear membrane protein enriched at telomere/subtelomere region n=1 Tax=Linnemannia gamsii TaxID=64522 RepID=A0ABQ7JTF1_9FUNG|nr:inner nuclear membrane protein enriched at telomere/subtelomere region [Linnemannia gamsii]
MSVPRYLQAGFDPMTIKMDSIREILIHHKVKPPTGEVRKQDLVDLFELHIRPRADELRKPYERANPKQGTITTKTSQLHQQQPKSTSQPLSQLPSSKSTASTATVVPPTRQEKSTALSSSTSSISSSSSKKREPRSSVNTKPIYTDDENEKSEGSKIQREIVSANFSDENPFQSGSESERRRRSKSRESLASAGSSRNSSNVRKPRRKSRDGESYLDRDHVFKVPAQPAFSKADFDTGPFHNSPLFAKTKRMSIPALPPPPPRIIQFESAANTYGARPKRSRDKEGPNLGPLKSIIFLALLSYGLWYRQTRIDIGFCTPSTFIPTPCSNKHFTTKQLLVKWLYPTCIACPDHANCNSPSSDPVCPPEYILRSHPLSFGNLLPLTPSCVLHKAQEYQSLQVADAAENILHKRAGQEECRGSTRPQPSAELFARQRFSTSELRKEIESLKDASISQEEFNQYWTLALNELYRRSSTIVLEQGIWEKYLRSQKPARPFFCRVRQGVLGWIDQLKEILLALLTLGIGGLLTRNYILRRHEETRIINGLVEDVLSKLSEQADACAVDPIYYTHSFVPQIHLRDALLAHIHSPVRRQDIWEKVSVIIDKNANVRVSAQELNGEIYRAWEWIGATGVLGQKKSLRASTRSTTSASGTSSGVHTTALTATATYDTFNDVILDETERSLHASTGGSLYPSLS